VKARSLTAQVCRAGHLHVDGARTKSATLVKAGDLVRARLRQGAGRRGVR
jgi:ribosomal 50S subunit-recycling heat shock protein